MILRSGVQDERLFYFNSRSTRQFPESRPYFKANCGYLMKMSTVKWFHYFFVTATSIVYYFFFFVVALFVLL